MLRLRAEVAGNVGLAEGLSQIAVNVIGAPLPARGQFLSSAQGFAVETEILVYKRGGEVVGGFVGGMPAQVGLPVRQAFLRNFLIQSAEVIGRHDVERLQRTGTGFGEVGVP